MASFNEVSGGSYVNVPTMIGAQVRNLVRDGTNVSFEYRAYIYQSSDVWSTNSWALWIEGSKRTVKNTTHSEEDKKYYASWVSKSISLSISKNSTTISIGVNGTASNPTSPKGYVKLTLSGIPVVSKPSLSDININNITDNYAFSYFDVTSNNGQTPYDKKIELSLTNFGDVIQTIESNDGVFVGLDANRQYFARGSASNDAGTSYTNVQEFTTVFNNPGNPTAPVLSYVGSSPTVSATLKASWGAASNGSTPVTGYKLTLYKNGERISEISTNTNATTYNFGLISSLNYNVGDVITFSVMAFSKDWNNGLHFSSTEIFSTNSIVVVSDKFIYISYNGEDFYKCKMFISVDGSEFTEVRKEDFKIIN